MRPGKIGAALLALYAQAALAQETFVVAPKTVADEKAVFATIESANVVPARARIGGTVVELAVKEGDAVTQGQIVATIGDEKLALQMKARTAERSVIQQQVTEGGVLAPTSGRVLKVPVTAGTVILPGETVATVAVQNFVLRLRGAGGPP